MPRKCSETVSFRCSEEDKAALKKLSATKDWSLSKLVRRAMEAETPVRAGGKETPAGASLAEGPSPPPAAVAPAAVHPAAASTQPPAPEPVRVYHIDELQDDPLRVHAHHAMRK